MGYEINKIQEIIMYDKDSGKEIGRFQPPISAIEEKDKATYTSTTIAQPPKPNIMFVISPGRKDGKYTTNFAFYRPKYYNWFQRFMYKICFGITIKQGDEVRREFL